MIFLFRVAITRMFIVNGRLHMLFFNRFVTDMYSVTNDNLTVVAGRFCEFVVVN